ncbi:hypothetical protein CC80DRAFT_491330 [Byssothecium circinans]|uniref:Uncharacterized protein n=1 Tax=Byssothecium circinans TaxID=147558 RepID=A0A6A5U2F3_9PLEO|nr:hypothetical protein CC80DRAFT_491330 [Byssothecium circinans]
MSTLFPLAKRATPEEARQKAGYSKVEWARFYELTKDEARRLTQENLSLTWPRTPEEKKKEVMDRINAALCNENMQPVGDDVLHWRMSSAVRDSRHNSSNRPAILQSRSAE